MRMVHVHTHTSVVSMKNFFIERCVRVWRASSAHMIGWLGSLSYLRLLLASSYYKFCKKFRSEKQFLRDFLKISKKPVLACFWPKKRCSDGQKSGQTAKKGPKNVLSSSGWGFAIPRRRVQNRPKTKKKQKK